MTELENLDHLLTVLRRFGVKHYKTSGIEIELEDAPGSGQAPASSMPIPALSSMPSENEILFHSSPLGPPDEEARPPACVACGGEQGPDQTGRLMCYGCGSWELMPEAAQKRYEERSPEKRNG